MCLFINNFYTDYLQKHSILAFIDSNEEKSNKLFFNKKIIKPSMIQNYQFDKIIICSSFTEEISNTLTHKLNISKECIITQKDICYNIYNDMITNKNFLQKKS